MQGIPKMPSWRGRSHMCGGGGGDSHPVARLRTAAAFCHVDAARSSSPLDYLTLLLAPTPSASRPSPAEPDLNRTLPRN